MKQYWASPSPVKKKNEFGKGIELEGIIRGERGASAPSGREAGEGGREKQGGREKHGREGNAWNGGRSMEGREKHGREGEEGREGGSGAVAHPDCHPACNRPINSS